MSHAVAVDSHLRDRAYIHGGSGIKVGDENYCDLWQLDLNTYTFTKITQNL